MRELPWEGGAVLAVLHVLDPFVDADRVCIEETLGLGRGLLVEEFLGGLAVSRGEEGAQVGEVVGQESA